ncbi:hypothetical protein FQN54_005346 [Arachnomyces sp. PD_36]|nr:hypothetical protein FQN54_005346 [Arachnomyces sp. PD_36]
MATTPSLSFDAIDDLIYSARIGDLDALKEDIANLSKEHNCPASAIIHAAIDAEDESEGGTGACLLHWPAANGNLEILTYLLSEFQHTISTTSSTTITTCPLVNHPNNSLNTPLHWAALNTHLDCVKALVEAGADVGAKNDAGHDAVFLAERTGWGAAEVGEGDGDEGGKEEAEAEAEVDAKREEEGGEGKGKGREVVEWLLGCKAGAELEKGAGAGNGEEGSVETDIKEDEMEGVVEAGKGKEKSQ